MTTVTVTIWHSVARDHEGRHTGMLEGYQPGDPMVHVFTYDATPASSPEETRRGGGRPKAGGAVRLVGPADRPGMRRAEDHGSHNAGNSYYPPVISLWWRRARGASR